MKNMRMVFISLALFVFSCPLLAMDNPGKRPSYQQEPLPEEFWNELEGPNEAMRKAQEEYDQELQVQQLQEPEDIQKGWRFNEQPFAQKLAEEKLKELFGRPEYAQLKQLTNNGQNLLAQTVDFRRQTPLMIAAGRGDINLIALLLEAGVPVDSRNSFGDTALMVAAYKDKAQAANFLLTKGADINATNIGGFTALMRAAMEDQDDQVARLLIERGADVNMQDKIGATALMEAASAARETLVHLLIDAGALVDMQDDSGDTALMRAVTTEDPAAPAIVRLLLQEGARPDIRNNEGETAYDLTEDEEIREILKNYQRFIRVD